MSDVTVTVRVTSEVTKEVQHVFNLEEFLEWSSGEEPTPKLVKEYIENDREYDEMVDAFWSLGREVENTVFPFPDVESVMLCCAICKERVYQATSGDLLHGHTNDAYCGTGDGATALLAVT